MGRPKIARKSTNIDMTAMCDVAFLLLSFFILTTKFKPDEAIAVKPPSSVSSKAAPEKGFVLVTIDKDGKAFLSMDDEDKKQYVAQALNSAPLSLGIDENEFVKAEFFGVPFNKLKQFLAIPKADRARVQMEGIPCKDSTNNEMTKWLELIKVSYSGQKMPLLLKGDNSSKYPTFKYVLEALKKNDILKFQLVTNPEGVPEGSELFKKHLKGEKEE